MVSVYCLITNETSSKRKKEEIYASGHMHACLFCFTRLCLLGPCIKTPKEYTVLEIELN